MSDEKNISPMSLSNLLALFALLGGVFWWVSPPIKSSRPSLDNSLSQAESATTNEVYSRLWQDPLSTLSSLAPATKALVPAEIDALQKELKDYPGPETLVLPVMSNGGPNPEDIEQRLRARSAVLAALGLSGYPPTRVERLRLLHVTLPSPGPLAWRATTPLELRIPYETCFAQYGNLKLTSLKTVKLVVVLWLRDDDFKEAPWERLAQLVGQLHPIGSESSPLIRIIGPNNSTTLRSMVLDAEEGVSELVKRQLSSVHMYAATPTVSDAILTYNSAWKQKRAPSTRDVTKLFSTALPGFQFVRCIHDDKQVLKAMITELRYRNVDVSSQKTHIAILSEWDTYYGRALPIAFAAEALNVKEDELIEASMERATDSTESPGPEKKIYRFHYMCGIDGRVAGTTRTSALPSDPQKARSEEGDPSERPEGLGQSDYLMRLAERLKALDQRLFRSTGTGLQAVGILGSDIYDKLMVLQALRSRLPASIFFTNSLDARLAHPHEWAETHNLIVASSFGLRLSADFAHDVAPFRDSYQTAVCEATLRATERLDNVAPSKTLLFEIARGGAVNLSKKSLQNSTTFIPAQFTTDLRYIIRLCLLAIAIIFLSYHSLRLVQGNKRVSLHTFTASSITAGVLGFATSAAIVVILFAFQRDAIEPFTLTGGISVWPSNVLRLFATFMACFFLVKGLRRTKQAEQRIARRFSLPLLPERDSEWLVGLHRFYSAIRGLLSTRPVLRFTPMISRRSLDARLRLLRRHAACGDLGISRDRAWGVLSPGTKNDESPLWGGRQVDVSKLWRQYVRRGRFVYRFERVLPTTVVYVGVALLLLSAFGWPLIPTRGAVAYVSTIVFDASAFTATVLLTFYVVDATRLTKTFVKYLSRGNSLYPKSTYSAYRTFRPIGAQDLLVDYIDIRLIAELTASVDHLIFYPFGVFFLLTISRINLFDNWDWPFGLIVAYVLLFSYALFSACSLRACAEVVRKDGLAKLRQRLLTYITRDDEKHVKVASETIAEIQSISDGAFAAFSKHPIFAAILLPSSGISIWVLLQYLPRSVGGM